MKRMKSEKAVDPVNKPVEGGMCLGEGAAEFFDGGDVFWCPFFQKKKKGDVRSCGNHRGIKRMNPPKTV